MTRDENTFPEATLHCHICGVEFAIPGFDSAQSAQVLAQHIAANHRQELDQALQNAPAPKETTSPVGTLPLGSGVPAAGTVGRTGEAATDTDSARSDQPDTTSPSGDAQDSSETAPTETSAKTPEAGDTEDATDPLTPPVETATDHDSAHDSGRRAGDDAGTTGGRPPLHPGRGNLPPIEDDLRRSRAPQADPRQVAPDEARGKVSPQDAAKDDPRNSPPKSTEATGAMTGVAPHDKNDKKDKTGAADERGGAQGVPSKTEPKRMLADKVKQSLPAGAGKASAGGAPKTGARSAFENGVTKGLQAAGASVGLPPIVTKALIRIVKRGVPLLVAAALVFATALFGGTLMENAPEDRVWDIPLSEQLDIPEPYLEAYQYAARTHKLPWTLLAAIGANASYHGRVDPYRQTVPLPVPRTASEPGEGKVVVLADQTLAGARTYIESAVANAGFEIEYVDLGSGNIDAGTDWLDDNRPDTDTTVVVGLGANEAGTAQEFSGKVDRLLNLLGMYTRVRWVTIDGSGQFNEVLGEKDGSHLRPNLRLVEWADVVESGGVNRDEAGNYDGQGQLRLATLITSAVAGGAVSAGLPVSADLTGPGVLPTPTGTCPRIEPGIAGETPAQGAGPLMLMPAALSAAGIDLEEDVQDICESADALAEVLAETARVVAEEQGTSFPRGIAQLAEQAGGGDTEAAERVHDFWADVVDRAGILGTVEERVCELPDQGSLEDQEWVGNAIDSYWRCALSGVELSSLASVTLDAAGNLDQRLLSQSEAVARGVDEALGVSWNWSSWGEAECNAEALHAGVFPLTVAVFEEYAEDPTAGRCDREQNIVAATEAFIAGESSPASLRPGFWNASIGGWGLIGPVSGPAGPDLFDTLGPWQPLSTNTECSRILVDGVLAASNDPAFLAGLTAAQAQALADAGSASLVEPLLTTAVDVDARLVAIVTAAQADPVCAQERAYSTEEWLGALAGAVNGDALTSAEDGGELRIPRRTTGNLDVAAGAGDRVAALSGRAFTRTATFAGGAPAVSAYLQRLSPIRVALLVRPAVSSEEGDALLSLGSRMVNIAVGYYGGIFIGNTGSALVGFGLVGDPIPFADEFNSVGQEYGIDPRLLAAVAKQESEFDPEAGCPSAGAFGMMQKEFDTVPSICGDVRRQIAVAAEMLLDLNQRAGDWKGALWGYNNGALFAQTWAEVNGDLSAAEEFAYDWYRKQGVCAAAGECARAEIAMMYISEDQGARSAMATWIEYQQLFPASVINTRQTTVNGNECPNVEPRSAIPGKTVLREGAEAVGIRELCVEAVAEAATSEAARAIIFAFNNLGISYSQALRSTNNAFDCSSYVSRAYESAGIVMRNDGGHFSTHSLFPHTGKTRPEWVVPIAVHAAKPGDMVFPLQGHVAMLLTRGFIIHTNATGDVSKVERGYANPIQVNRVVPELAPRIGS